MPPRDRHLQIAAENRHVLTGLNAANGPARGWASTIAFYEAIHLVEAFLAMRSVHSVDHRTRDSNLARFKETKRIYVEFSELKNVSINARYHGRYPTDDDFGLIVMNALNTIRNDKWQS